MKQQDWLLSWKWRYATKVFDSTKKIESPLIHRLLEGLRLSPSSFGLQLWKFLVIEDVKLKKLIRPLAWNQAQIEDCSHLIILCRKDNVTDDDINKYIQYNFKIRNIPIESQQGFYKIVKEFLSKKNPSETQSWLSHQTYIALGALMLSAAIEEVDSCPIEGFDQSAVNQLLKLPEQGLHAQALCALGYRSCADTWARKDKVRYPSEDLIHWIDQVPK